jgi:putative heme-binding domain-containing protein
MIRQAVCGRYLKRRLLRGGVVLVLGVTVLLILDSLLDLPIIREGTAQDSSEIYKRVYNGWKWWHVYCYRCHGVDAIGTALAPNLTDSNRKLGEQEFLQLVRNGTPQKGMPAWDQLLNDQQITEVYTYVRARTENLLPRGRPDEVGPNGGPWIPPAGWVAGVSTSAAKAPEAIAAPPVAQWAPYIQGNPEVGKALFHDLQGKAACARCHVADGKGKAVGPDLSKIGQKPPQYLVESVLNPSAQIVPGYESIQTVTKKGRHIRGIKKKEDSSMMQVVDSQGTLFTVQKEEIQQNEKSTTSLMPDNFRNTLTIQDFHDLLAYLLMLK